MLATLPVLLPLVLGVLLFLMSLLMLIRRGVLGVLFRAILPLVLLIFSIALIFGGFDIMSYRQLLKESAVATVHLEKMSPQSYTATLITDDYQKSYFQLKGDQWQVDARIIRWHPNLTRMGFETIYRMDRISGRYNSLQQELHAERTVYPISVNSYGIDMWRYLRDLKWLDQWIDATYGSATYVPMRNGAIYEIRMGYSGLSVHPTNAASREAITAWQ